MSKNKPPQDMNGESEQTGNHRNGKLLNALPHPAMIINKDRTILAANRIAKEVGATVGGLCWRDFGHGSTFHIYLPLAEDTRENQEADGRRKPITGTARILVVDDEEVLREIATDMLKMLGYTVTVCKDGKEAVKYYEKSWQDIDLVILDMVMPELGGRDTFAAMRKINPAVRAILSSGYSINGEAQSILDDGVMAFVGKPFDQTELSEKVAQVLGGVSYQ